MLSFLITKIFSGIYQLFSYRCVYSFCMLFIEVNFHVHEFGPFHSIEGIHLLALSHIQGHCEEVNEQLGDIMKTQTVEA